MGGYSTLLMGTGWILYSKLVLFVLFSFSFDVISSLIGDFAAISSDAVNRSIFSTDNALPLLLVLLTILLVLLLSFEGDVTGVVDPDTFSELFKLRMT